MTSSRVAEELRARVTALSGRQRDMLAAALSEAHGAGRGRRLVAYVTTGGETPSGKELDSFLSERVPSYMVPERYVVVDRLPRTHVGKLDRRALTELEGAELAAAPAGLVGPRNDIEARLMEIWTEVLGVDVVSVHDDFFEIGGDSLLSIRVIARAGRAGMPVTPEVFFDHPTVASLAGALELPQVGTDQGTVLGRASLTPIQEWFFERITEGQGHWNQAFLLIPPPELSQEALRRIVRMMVAHHDALRLRLVRDGGRWHQEIPPPYDDIDVRRVDLTGYPPAERATRLQAEADAEHASLDPEAGRLFRVVLFEGSDGWRRLLLLAHHLVVDMTSWGVLVEDLSTLVEQVSSAGALTLPAKTVSVLDWSQALIGEAGSPRWNGAGVHWSSIDDQAPPRPAGRVGDAATLTVSLDESETRALADQAGPRLSASIEVLALGAFVWAWSRMTGRTTVQIDVEGHGRDAVRQLDASRTVGWFTSVFPLNVELAEDTTQGAAQAVLRALSGLPGGRSLHGMLRYLHPDPAVRGGLAAQPRSSVLFNYLGSADALYPRRSMLKPAPEPAGHPRSATAPRAYAIEVNSIVRSGRLEMMFEYPVDLMDATAVQTLADDTGAALRSFLHASGSGGARYDLSGLDEAGLARVAELLDATDGA